MLYHFPLDVASSNKKSVRSRVKRYLSLDHGWSLCAQQTHVLKHVHDALKAHSLQRDTQRDEHARPTNSHADRSQTHRKCVH